MKKQTYTAPEIILVDLAVTVSTALDEQLSANREGSPVMLSWLLDE